MQLHRRVGAVLPAAPAGAAAARLPKALQRTIATQSLIRSQTSPNQLLAMPPRSLPARLLPGLALCSQLGLWMHALVATGAAPVCGWTEGPAPAPAPGGWRRALAPEPGPRPRPPQRIIDVSIGLDESTVQFNSRHGLGKDWRVLEASQARGDAYTSSLLRLSAHTGADAPPPWRATLRGLGGWGAALRRLHGQHAGHPAFPFLGAGTHVDGPGHFLAHASAAPDGGVDHLDLSALNGGQPAGWVWVWVWMTGQCRRQHLASWPLVGGAPVCLGASGAVSCCCRTYACGGASPVRLIPWHAGPALVVDITTAGSNITAALLESLALPRGVERLIFKTDNTIK